MDRLVLFSLFSTVLVLLFGRAMTYASVPAAKSHTQCLAKELQRKDCELTLKPYKVQLSGLKITWSDGTWTSIGDAPMVEEKFQWEKVNFQNFEKRHILQFWIWDDGKGEAKVQSLHWVVMELKEKQLIPHIDKIVRKREVRETKPVSYTYDSLTPHSLKKIKGGLRWTVGRNAGTI